MRIHATKLAALGLALLLSLTLSPAALARAAQADAGPLSSAELAAFDGREGRRAYVAVDGVIYDVTDSSAWTGGAHMGLEAGRDLTGAFAQSPHEASLLEGLPVVGRLEILLTIEELAAFDGKEGRRAYVAVDGLIYDVTDSRAWKNGEHKGFEAGRDLTREIREVSPHGVGKLENVTEVGRLVLKLTLEQLSEFDGKDGRRAYVAVDGIIYDVTDSRAWKDGAHKGFEAGRDLTREIREVSPHGVGKLENVAEVGIIVE